MLLVKFGSVARFLKSKVTLQIVFGYKKYSENKQLFEDE